MVPFKFPPINADFSDQSIDIALFTGKSAPTCGK